MVAGTSKSVRGKLTKRTVDAASLPDVGESRIWDQDLAGFCLRVYAKGRKSPEGRKVYALKYRVGRLQRWFTIGEHGNPWTPQQARDTAETILHDAAAGKDHQAAKLERRADLTVSELIDAYLDEGPAAKPSKRASSWTQDRSSLVRHVRPLIGKEAVRSCRKANVARMVVDIREGKTAANVKTGKQGRAIVRGGPGVARRTLSTVCAMWNWAVEQGHATENPATGIELPRRAAKARFLSDVESIRLFATLGVMVTDKTLNAAHADIFRLLALTGARLTEIAGLRWDEVEHNARRIVLPPSRSKSGEKTGERRIALNSLAREILARRPRTSEYVFPAHRGNGHVVGLQKPWARVRVRAELPGLRIHDLRHSFASFAIADGATLYAVGKALGHADSRTTEIYAHLGVNALDDLAEGAGRRMSAQREDER